jgi:hypothetical protein
LVVPINAATMPLLFGFFGFIVLLIMPSKSMMTQMQR